MTVEEINAERGRVAEVEGRVWFKSDKFIPSFADPSNGREARFVDNGEVVQVMVGDNFVPASELKTFSISLASLKDKFGATEKDKDFQAEEAEKDAFGAIFAGNFESPEGAAVREIYNDIFLRFSNQSKLYDADRYEDLAFGE